MKNLEELQTITKDQSVDPYFRMQAFLNLSALSKDQLQILHYMEDHQIGIQYPEFWFCLASNYQKRGDFRKVANLLKFMRKKQQFQGQQQKINQYQASIQTEIQSIIKTQIAVGNKKSLNTINSKKYVDFQNNQIVHYQDVQIYVDQSCRQHHKLQPLLRSFQYICTQFKKQRKLAVKAQNSYKPLSWISKQAKKFNIIFEQLTGIRQSTNKQLQIKIDELIQFQTPKKKINDSNQFSPKFKSYDSIQLLKLKKWNNKNSNFQVVEDENNDYQVKRIVANVNLIENKKKVRFNNKTENFMRTIQKLRNQQSKKDQLFIDFSFKKIQKQEQNNYKQQYQQLKQLYVQEQNYQYLFQPTLYIDEDKENKKPNDYTVQNLIDYQIDQRQSLLTHITQTSRQYRDSYQQGQSI